MNFNMFDFFIWFCVIFFFALCIILGIIVISVINTEPKIEPIKDTGIVTYDGFMFPNNGLITGYIAGGSKPPINYTVKDLRLMPVIQFIRDQNCKAIVTGKVSSNRLFVEAIDVRIVGVY